MSAHEGQTAGGFQGWLVWAIAVAFVVYFALPALKGLAASLAFIRI